MNEHDKLAIADEMLETAIELYLDSQKYFSSLHLAGAAQEIYGKWLMMNGSRNFDTVLLDAMGASPDNRKSLLKSVNRSKNSVKHIDNKDDRYVVLQPQEDAYMKILTAFMEYRELERGMTNNINRLSTYISERITLVSE